VEEHGKSCVSGIRLSNNHMARKKEGGRRKKEGVGAIRLYYRHNPFTNSVDKS
jgi:hypothetical protein